MKVERKNVVFTGKFSDLCIQYINYKRSQGFDINHIYQRTLYRLGEYLDTNCETISLPEDIVNQFLNQYSETKIGTQLVYESMIRQFGLFMRNSGIDNVYILPEKRKYRYSSFVPYIFTESEIHEIFRAADHYKYLNPIGAVFYPTILRLLYGTGMRISEATNLRVDSVDLTNGVINVLHGKNNVSRVIPVSDSLRKCLQKYHDLAGKDSDEYFFESPKSGPRQASAITSKFIGRFLPNAGINPCRGDCNIRLHDLRHTFACHSLNKMIHEGWDPFCALPYLSTYMGHKGIESTEKYLRLTAEHYREITDACHHIYEGILKKYGE